MELKRIIMILILLIIITIVFYIIANTITELTGRVTEKAIDDLAYAPYSFCLSRQDIKLYINDENPEETVRNLRTVKYIEHADIYNCKRNKELCSMDGIVWVINGESIERDVSVHELLKYSGCER
jgi:hypothetical protein